MIDLRSDTLTLPSAEMLAVIPEAVVGDSGRWDEKRRGEDPTVNALEDYGAALVGKEAALFCNSGTMGNTVALLTHCRPGDAVLLDDHQHLYRTEKGAFSPRLGQLKAVIYGADEKGNPNVDSIDRLLSEQPIKLLCLENSNNNRGGQCMPVSLMKEIYQVAHQHGVPVHLDGARIFNAAHALQVQANEIAQYSDTCMFCVSKGLGAPVGSLVCGTVDAVFAMRETRRLLGGDMRQAGVIAAPALYALQHNIPRLRIDNQRAAQLAGEIQGLQVIHCPAKVDTNIVMLSVPHGRAEELARRLRDHDISSGAVDEERVRLVFHMDITDDDLQQVIRTLRLVDQEMR